MNRQICLRLARPFVLLLLLAGVLLFGANNAAWATPAQSGLAAPTVPKRNELLEIKNITCRQQVPVVEFDVSNLSASSAITFVLLTRSSTATNSSG